MADATGNDAYQKEWLLHYLTLLIVIELSSAVYSSLNGGDQSTLITIHYSITTTSANIGNHCFAIVSCTRWHSIPVIDASCYQVHSFHFHQASQETSIFAGRRMQSFFVVVIVS